MATAAQQDAELSADSTALVARQLLDTSAKQLAETPSSLETRHATTATPTVGMDAVLTAQRLRQDGVALLFRAVSLIARKSAETVSELPEKDAMTAIRQRVTAAVMCAQSSADTTALLHGPTSATQHAETPSSLATRHVTTATPKAGMDAVLTAQRLRQDGVALLFRAVSPVARKSVETVSELPEKDAMTATRQLATAAVLCAQSSADTTAVMHNPTFATQLAETPSSLAERHATISTSTAGMDAVLPAQ
jgi:hypothetical protein